MCGDIMVNKSRMSLMLICRLQAVERIQGVKTLV